MGITVLGPLTVDGSGRLGPRDRVVLQALATRPGQPVRKALQMAGRDLTEQEWDQFLPAQPYESVCPQE